MLSEHHVGLLYEIYEITFRENTVVAGGNGTTRIQPDIYASGQSVRDRLNQAITLINASEYQSTRVKEILEEYEELSLDPSTINKEGYNLRPLKNINLLRKRLYPYTGILLFNGSYNNSYSLG